MITYDSICKKCGFDINKGPSIEDNDGWRINDKQPRIFYMLTEEEKKWVYEYYKNKKYIK